ncbi:MAG: aminoacyl-histidine dipeptidase [Gammaproteobacteria bacterium]|nr:aminoacyl-histidine dipeptidase [Gammaproteobacteria bacterium]
MTHNLEALSPQSLWRIFYQLTRIPRPSHHEEAIRNHLMGFSQGLGLESRMDDHGNVVICKPATDGMERRQGVILQGHLDMVPQANSDTDHDFTKEPIQTQIVDQYVKAVGTTLGADNGIGVAAVMAVLESNTIRHGPLEALFTANEEDGMDGAFGLEPGSLNGNILLNTDSEDEGVLCIGCAGGANVNTHFDYAIEPVSGDLVAFKLTINGLKGGHSGVDIHRGRGNANKLLFRLIREIQERHNLRICTVKGGNMRNAIPRESFARVTLPVEEREGFLESVSRLGAIYAAELSATEPGLLIDTIPEQVPNTWMESTAQQNLIDALSATPHGVCRMSDRMPGLVESSTNLAIVQVEEGKAEILSLVRSSIDSARNEICESIRCLFNLTGARTTFDGHYPGWKPNPDSPILALTKSVYEQTFDAPAEVGGIHAGLECGILGATYPDWDMISFGPTIRFPHSPDEQVDIPSVERFWKLLVAILEAIPEKLK